MSVVGFDFGTTNSLISVIRGGKPINYLDDQGRPIPSVVCYEGARKIVGREAKQRLTQAGLGVHGNVVRSPKMYLGDESIFVEGVERNPVDVVADVVQHIISEAKGGTRGRDLKEISGAVVTIPVDMNGIRRRRLRDAFRQAGLPIFQFVHEPLAALYGLFRSQDVDNMLRRYERKPILVFDWGGGTLDLTLCRPTREMFVQLMNDGTDEVGGDVFDELIMNSIIKNVVAARGYSSVEFQLGAKSRLLDSCERAKIDLSSRNNVAVYVPSFFRGVQEDAFDYTLAQAEMEAIVKPILDKGFRRIEKILNDADFAPEQVALCVATGGMSNMPAVRRRLHELFGAERVQIPDRTATLIAEGAAWIAHDKVGLTLAKNIELVLARNSYFPLVKAGTNMPREGEVLKDTLHLYCTDPRDGVAKFQLSAPKRCGRSVLANDPRSHLENLTIKVDQKAHAFHERLELDVIINDDLILEAHARSLVKKDEDKVEIHNLEFGLNLQESVSEEEISDEASFVAERTHPADPERGSLSLRANVSTSDDPSLVPGEYLHSIDSGYFDVRNNPPKQQVAERLYYEPCFRCGRASNDPKCKCG
jgi:molecular chaperone DnaK